MTDVVDSAAQYAATGRQTANVRERAARWFRVSTDSQDEANQVSEVDRHCQGRGYQVARTFTLHDVSASKGEQAAALAEVVADIRAGAYSVLVTAHSSRLDRRDDLDAQAMFLIEVRRAGGRIEVVRQPAFGTTDRLGRLVTFLSQDANAEYSRALSDAVKAANARIDATGHFRGGRPPWGYRVTGEKYAMRMEPVSTLKSTITELFQRVAADQSIPVVSAWLEEAHGIAKNNSSITATIRRPLYWTGRYEVASADGTVAVHRTQAIVSHDLWAAANAALDARPSTNARPRLPRQPDYSGRLFCGYCSGKAYRAYGGDHGKRTRSYYCKACHRGWRADLADELTEALMLADHSPELGIVIVPGSDHTAELARVTDELASLPRRNLPDRAEDRERRRLRAERDRLSELPVVPARRETGFTGRLMSEAWASSTHAEKCAYLSGDDFLVVLMGRGRDVTVERVWPEEDE